MSEASNAAAARLAPLKAWWAALAERERRLLAVAGLVVGLYLVFVITIQPAWRTLSRAPAQQEALDLQLQTMTRLAAEAGELRAMPPVNVEQSSTALKAASDRLGDKGRLSLQGDRAVLTLNGAGTEQLRSWLAEVRSGARARPVEANLARGTTGYNGTIVVAIGSGT